MKLRKILDEAVNKKDAAYKLAIDYTGNTKPKITKFNKKGMTVYYGYKVNPEDVIKSLVAMEPTLKIKHKKWSSISSGGGTHEFVFEGKVKGADGKACWKGYRYAGTENGKDKCVKEGVTNEAKLRKGDLVGVDDEIGVVNKVKGRVAYIKLPSSPGSFHPIEAERAKYKGKFKGKDLYIAESLSENEYFVKKDDHDCFTEWLIEEKDTVLEAEYQGRKVNLNKPMQGDVSKFKVYVKKGDKVVKVNFGAKGMVIKKDNPGARASFRARFNCDSPGPKTKARYWSCRKW